MPTETKECPDVIQRFADLGMKPPEGCCILPRSFWKAETVSDLCHESSALDLKSLFRQANLPIVVYQPDGQKIPYLQENDIHWTGPILFFAVAQLSENPNLISVALGVISNYVTGIFKGSVEQVRARLSVVVEMSETKTTKKITKRYDYDGPPDQIADIIKLIKEDEK
jgi:hypothetical protein